MFGGINDLFDLDGDGTLNVEEMAMAYTMLFGNSEESDDDSLSGLHGLYCDPAEEEW